MAQVISLTSNLRRKAAHTSADEPRPPVGRFTRPATPPEPRRIVWTKFDTNATLLIGLWTLITRFVGLNSAVADGTPVFDEKHYVPQAWDMVNSWVNPLIGGIESNPGYGLVVHPPLAKQIEAYGELIFGYTALGWRIMAALFGTATVLLIMNLARQLTGSSVIAAATITRCVFDSTKRGSPAASGRTASALASDSAGGGSAPASALASRSQSNGQAFITWRSSAL